MMEEKFVYGGWLAVGKALFGIETSSNTTWCSVEAMLYVVLMYVLGTQERITLKERKHQINDKDKPKGINLKYY